MTQLLSIIILLTFIAGGDLQSGPISCTPDPDQERAHYTCSEGSKFNIEMKSWEKSFSIYDNRQNVWVRDPKGIYRYKYEVLFNRIKQPFGRTGYAFYIEGNQIIDNQGQIYSLNESGIFSGSQGRWRVYQDRFGKLTFSRI